MGRCTQAAMLTNAFLTLLVVALPYQLAWGQLKPELDEQIPSYQPVAQLSGAVQIAGSQTMKLLTEGWAQKLRLIYPSLSVTVTSEGSEAGLALLLEGKVQIAAMSRRINQQEILEFKREFGYEPTEVPVGIDALAVYVHKENPLPGLTLAELDAMFCDERRRGLLYDLRHWSDFVLEGDWDNAPIRLYVPNNFSGTTSFFHEHVCNGAPFKKHADIRAGSASVVIAIAQDRLGIGFSGIGYKTSGVRPVPLAAVKGGRYIEPSFESAIDGIYPLRRPLYLYLNKPPKDPVLPALVEYVKLALSLQGQRIVLSHGYYPLPTAELKRLTMMLTAAVRAAATERPATVRN